LIKPFKPIARETRTLDGGNWHGNDSAWRMTADLAKILFFADKQGVLQSTRQRNMLCVVDGIVAGELDGPLAPTAKACGCVVAGTNPFAVDLATTRLMGFDYARIKQFSNLQKRGWDFGFHDPDELRININGEMIQPARFFSAGWNSPLPAFIPHAGWRGHIELSASANAS
jgi:Domain of unknown function (DUF362)